MKKFLLSFATFALALGFVGCKPGPDDDGGQTPPATGGDVAVYVTAGETTQTSLTFSVDADNATTVKYLVHPEGVSMLEAEPVPEDETAVKDAAYVLEHGALVEEVPAKVVVEELDLYTTYDVWVAAQGADGNTAVEKVQMKTKQGELVLSGLGSVDQFTVSPSGASADWIVQNASQLQQWCLTFHGVASLDELEGKYYVCSSQEKADELSGKEGAAWIDAATSTVTCDGVAVSGLLADSEDCYLEALKSPETNSTSFRLNAYSASEVYFISAIYLKGGEAEAEDVKAGREMDAYTTLEIVKNGNQYTLLFSAFSGVFTCVVETADGELSNEGFTEYVLNEEGTGSWKSGNIREDMYNINVTSGSLLIRKMSETKYRFIVNAEGRDNGQSVDVVISCKASNGWDADVKSFTDEEHPAEKVELTLTTVDVTLPVVEGDDKVMTFTGSDAEGNKVVLTCHSNYDYLCYNMYVATDATEVAKLNSNLPHLYWVESGKSYVEYKGTKYPLLANNPNSYFRIKSHEMPYVDNNSASFLAWNEENTLEFSFSYTGAFNYKNVFEKVSMVLSSLNYEKASDTGRVLHGTDASGNKMYLHCELDSRYADNDYLRKARYPYRTEADATASNKNWTDTTKSYVEYNGVKYYFSTASTAHYVQVAGCEMPAVNSTSIKVTGLSTEGYKEFTIDYSGAVEGYTGAPVEMKPITISGWVASGITANADNSEFSTFMAQAEVASATYQIKFNVYYMNASSLKVGKHYVASSQVQANEFAGSTENVLWMDAASSLFYYNGSFYSLKADKDSFLEVKDDGTFTYSVKTSNGLYQFSGNGSAVIPEADEEVGSTGL